MYKFLKNVEWLSIEDAIEPLGAILGIKCKCREDVLHSVLKRGLQASVYIESPQIQVYPMVRLTGDEAVEFKRDEQQTHTYKGPSFQIDNNFLAPSRVLTLLPREAILDLPIKPASDYLYRLRYSPVPDGKRLVLPPQTLLKVPGTDDYFMSDDSLNAPDVFCEIVIRTQAIQEFQRQQIELKEAPAKDTATPAPVAAVALGGEAWINKARERAAEIIKRQREKDLYPNQEHIGDEIAREFRAAGTVGTDGKPLSGAYIKRRALTGISSDQGKQLSTRTGRGK